MNWTVNIQHVRRLLCHFRPISPTHIFSASPFTDFLSTLFSWCWKKLFTFRRAVAYNVFILNGFCCAISKIFQSVEFVHGQWTAFDKIDVTLSKWKVYRTRKNETILKYHVQSAWYLSTDRGSDFSLSRSSIPPALIQHQPIIQILLYI